MSTTTKRLYAFMSDASSLRGVARLEHLLSSANTKAMAAIERELDNADSADTFGGYASRLHAVRAMGVDFDLLAAWRPIKNAIGRDPAKITDVDDKAALPVNLLIERLHDRSQPMVGPTARAAAIETLGLVGAAAPAKRLDEARQQKAKGLDTFLGKDKNKTHSQEEAKRKLQDRLDAALAVQARTGANQSDDVDNAQVAVNAANGDVACIKALADKVNALQFSAAAFKAMLFLDAISPVMEKVAETKRNSVWRDLCAAAKNAHAKAHKDGKPSSHAIKMAIIKAVEQEVSTLNTTKAPVVKTDETKIREAMAGIHKRLDQLKELNAITSDAFTRISRYLTDKGISAEVADVIAAPVAEEKPAKDLEVAKRLKADADKADKAAMTRVANKRQAARAAAKPVDDLAGLASEPSVEGSIPSAA